MRRLFKREDFLAVKRLQAKGRAIKDASNWSGWSREICRMAYISASWSSFRARVVRRIKEAKKKRWESRRKLYKVLAEAYEQQCFDFIDSDDNLTLRIRRQKKPALIQLWKWLTHSTT